MQGRTPDPTDSVLSSAFEGASVSMMLTDLDGTILKSNAAFRGLLGYAADQLHGRRFEKITHPADLERILELFHDLVSGQRASYTVDKRCLASDGTTRWVRVTTAVVRNHAGSVQYVLATAEDIEAERSAVQHLASARRELAQARRLEAIGRVTGSIAHDFGNLINVLHGYAEEIAEQLEPSHSMQYEVRGLLEASDRATRLIRGLLAFSGQEQIPPRPVDIARLVRDLLPMLRRLPGEGITIALDLAPYMPLAAADPTQIEQVVLNLVSNARRAMLDGGVVTVAAREASTPGHVTLSVADHGLGMDAETRERIFEPFFTTHRNRGGTGMGLASVYGIVRGFGGTISVESEPGQGSTFTVTLPVYRE